MRKWTLYALTLSVFAIGGQTCSFPNNPDDKDAALQKFNGEEELRQYLVERVRERNGNGGGFFGNLFDGLLSPTTDVDFANDAAPEAGSDDGDYSTTNIQEAGVDESDLVKNDGQYIYALQGSTVHIVQATPAEQIAEIATVELDATGDSLYLYGSKLVALSQEWNWGAVYDDVAVSPGNGRGPRLLGGPFNDGVQTLVTVVDVTDPANPVVDATVTLEGQLSSSRMIDGMLHVILTTTPYIPYDYSVDDLDDLTLDEWLPDYQVESAGAVVAEGDIVSWTGFYRPATPDGYGITTVVTIDVEQPTAEFASTAITADAGVIYASTESLYVTDTQYDWQSGSGKTDTIVHKLAFADDGTDYIASGSVPGRPLNQYSLGEYEGYLRIATTVEEFGFAASSSSNAVYVLGENGAELETVGAIEDIAVGETIYAARFMGQRGYLVTFQRIDPLFVLDLSDPTAPAVIGELKVPGYSDHIQIMDDTHLLTIGKDAQDTGEFAWVQGVQLSIFDISNPASPTLMHKEIVGARGTNSEANYNPKAFNYFPAREALAFPIDLYTGDTTGPEYGTHTFTGLLVYHVTVADGFTELGRISSVDEQGQGMGYCWNWWAGFTRGVFIGDYVYAVTDRQTKVAALADVNTLVGQADYSGIDVGNDCGWPVEPEFDILPVEAGGLQ